MHPLRAFEILVAMVVMAVLVVMAMALPLGAQPLVTGTLPKQTAGNRDDLGSIRGLDSALLPTNNFFNQGQEQFEEEIYRLNEGQYTLEAPVLSIDEVVKFDPVWWEENARDTPSLPVELPSETN